MRSYDAVYRQLKAVLDAGAVGPSLMIHAEHRNPTLTTAYSTDMAITDTLIHEINGPDYWTISTSRPRWCLHGAAAKHSSTYAIPK